MVDEKENLFECMRRLAAQGIDPVDRHDEIWERYGETVAVLILDSSGFSRVSESHGILHFLSRLVRMRDGTKSIFESHNCRKLHFEADNVFATFDHPDEAIACARNVHRAVYDAQVMLTEEERFRVCIGIGYGKMLYSETLEGYFSEEMNFASKLGEDTADPDQTLITESAFSAASADLTKDFVSQAVSVSGVDLNYYLCQEAYH